MNNSASHAALDALPGRISSRPIAPGDLDFLCRLYRSTRWDETAATGWTHEERCAFLDMQFHVQHHYYQEHFADAQFRLLLQDQRPAGRLYWRMRARTLTLIDISLVPEQRSKGIGTAVISWITRQADEHASEVTLHVEPHNRARRLYQRLGFEPAGDNRIYLAMRRAPRAGPSTSQQHSQHHAGLTQP